MTVDVVCAGAPFLDLVFRGLPRLPAAGEEILADDVAVTPGAMANVAFALRQLGLDAVVCAPVGTDPPGVLLQALMADAGIPWIGEPRPSTPLSVGLPIDGERAFVTHFPTSEVDVKVVGALDARAVVINLPLPPGLPPGPRLIGVVGDPQVARMRQRPPESWADLHAVIVNEREAIGLTDRPDGREAARALASRGCLVIVTRGDAGVVAVDPSGACQEAAAVPVTVHDTVGAGDLFTAAWLWADLADRPLDESLAAAVAYSAFSLAAPGTRQKGLSRAAFLEIADLAGRSRSWMREVRG
ncbi:MAG TPA: PfkB family carbohydrate kinase [Candidatus Limnocylindrales bacterium]|nr:PfkB family carbohydrate kinase [Candidatus Limnocylindrales bacterium]